MSKADKPKVMVTTLKDTAPTECFSGASQSLGYYIPFVVVLISKKPLINANADTSSKAIGQRFGRSIYLDPHCMHTSRV